MEVLSYLNGRGLAPHKEGNSYGLKVCPFCQHKDCFKVNVEKDFAHCFSCEASGNSYKLEALFSGISYREAKAKLSGIKLVSSTASSSLPRSSSELMNANHKRLMENEEYLSWLTDVRGFSLDVIKKFKLGCYESKDGKIIYNFPYFSRGIVKNCKSRTADKKLLFFKKGAEVVPYNIDVAKHTEKLMIVEGEPDVLAAYTMELGIAAIGLPIGAKAWKATWDERLLHIKSILICLDSDRVGKESAKSLARKLGPRTKIVKLPPDMKDMNDCLTHNIPKEEIIKCIDGAKNVNQLEIVEAIAQISKDEQLVGQRINEQVLPLISEQPLVEVQDYLELIKNRFGISYKQMLDFRKKIDSLVYHKKNSRPDKKPKKVEVVLTDEQKEQAMAFLKSPKILDDLEQHLENVGIVGENNNKVCLWLFALTRKMPKKINAVIFGQSSSGKSELAKGILSTVPKDEIVEISSLTARSLEYADENILDSKIISIAEMEGVSEETEFVIRTAISEGVLNRLHTIKDENTGEMTCVERKVPVSSMFLITTTRSELNNENSTRVFHLYSDETLNQTKRVSKFIKETYTREYQQRKITKEKTIETLKNAQSLLRPIDVVVPYANEITFVENTTRNRRDLSRFIQCISVICFLRQHQKEVKKDSYGSFIEASIDDYRLCYERLLPILANTLSDVSPRAMVILAVCCTVEQDLKDDGLIPLETGFTVKRVPPVRLCGQVI